MGGLLRVQMLMVDVVGLYAAVQEQGTDALAQVSAMAAELRYAHCGYLVITPAGECDGGGAAWRGGGGGGAARRE